MCIYICLESKEKIPSFALTPGSSRLKLRGGFKEEELSRLTAFRPFYLCVYEVTLPLPLLDACSYGVQRTRCDAKEEEAHTTERAVRKQGLYVSA